MNHPAPPIASHEQWLKEAEQLLLGVEACQFGLGCASVKQIRAVGLEDMAKDARSKLLAHLRAAPVVAPAEPVAWLHEVTEPEDQQAGRAHSLLSRQPDNPWGHWREDYKGRCTFKSTPLYTAPPKESPSAPAAPSEQEQFAAKRANGVALPATGPATGDVVAWKGERP